MVARGSTAMLGFALCHAAALLTITSEKSLYDGVEGANEQNRGAIRAAWMHVEMVQYLI